MAKKTPTPKKKPVMAKAKTTTAKDAPAIKTTIGAKTLSNAKSSTGLTAKPKTKSALGSEAKAKAKKVVAEVVTDEPEIYDVSSDIEPFSAASSSEEPSTGRSLAVSDPVALYLQEIRKYPLLTREQEFELAKRYFETKDPAAAQALVTANLRFVVKVAADYSKFGARMIDLIQEGNMGLMHGVRDFNPHKGVRLITYAVWWIRGYIQEYLLKQYSMVKIATTLNQKKLFYRLQKEKEALDKMGITPDMKLIGSRMGIPAEEVEQMAQRMSGRDVSLSTPLDSESGTQMIDVQKSSVTSIDDELGLNQELSVLKEKLEELRPELSDREKIILEERLLADEPLTLQEIGEKYGITREAVRQMEARLMKKIKDRVREEL